MLTLHAILTLTIVKALLVTPAVIVDQNGNKLPVVHTAHPVPENCDYHCTRMDVPVCASNGQCTQLFQSECAMSGYNCKHPHKPFVVIDDWKCEQSWAPLCESHELPSM